MDFQLLATLRDETREAVSSLLRTHNQRHNSSFFSTRELEENSPAPLNVIAHDDDGSVVGGLIAETQFLWLKIAIMAVAESARRRGIGRKLLEMAEREALARGCRYAFLDTLDYQGPEFYEKIGYRLAGKLENWDSHGHAKFLFTKELSRPSQP